MLRLALGAMTHPVRLSVSTAFRATRAGDHRCKPKRIDEDSFASASALEPALRRCRLGAAASGEVESLKLNGLTEDEHILSHTNGMHISGILGRGFGHPRASSLRIREGRRDAAAGVF